MESKDVLKDVNNPQLCHILMKFILRMKPTPLIRFITYIYATAKTFTLTEGRRNRVGGVLIAAVCQWQTFCWPNRLRQGNMFSPLRITSITHIKYIPFILPMLIILLNLSGCTERYQRFSASPILLFDTIVSFSGYADNDEEAFMAYATIVYERLEELHRYFDIFNSYDGINNIYTINANAGIQPVPVGQDIINLLLAAQESYHLTGGMTNVVLGPVLRIWHEYRTGDSDALPSLEVLKAAALLTDISYMIIDEENSTVFMQIPGMSLDVGAIAKGFAAELAMEAAINAGMNAMLLNAGGHIVVHGIPPGQDAWNVGINNPSDLMMQQSAVADIVTLTNSTVSISGGYQRFFQVDGQAFGHIIDPATLFPAQRYQQVTVIHPVSWMADAISTALFILPLDEGKALAAKIGAEALWIDLEGNWAFTPGYAEIFD